MLRERILTALVLAPLVLCSILFLPMLGFEIAMIGVLGLGAWEWAADIGLLWWLFVATSPLLLMLKVYGTKDN